MKYPDRFWVYVLHRSGRPPAHLPAESGCGITPNSKMLLISPVGDVHRLSHHLHRHGQDPVGLYNMDSETALDGRYAIHLPEEPFARSDLYDSMDNLGMYWHLPTSKRSHSIVPRLHYGVLPPGRGKRDVSSKPGIEYFPLALLLSVRWFL